MKMKRDISQNAFFLELRQTNAKGKIHSGIKQRLCYLSLVVVLWYVFAYLSTLSHTSTLLEKKLLTVQLLLEVGDPFRQCTLTASCDLVPRVQGGRTGEGLEG